MAPGDKLPGYDSFRFRKRCVAKHGIPKDAHSVLTHEVGKLEERERRDPRSIDPDHPLRDAFRRVVRFLEERFEATEPRPS